MSFQGISPIMFGTPSMTTTTLGANDPELGTRATWNGGEYVFVYNGGGTQISVHLGAVASLTVSGFTVTVSSLTQVDVLFGVCQHNTIAASAYGWLLTRGFGVVAMGADNSAAVGGILALGSDGAFAKKASANTDIFLPEGCGKFQSAVASGASGNAWIRAFG